MSTNFVRAPTGTKADAGAQGVAHAAQQGAEDGDAGVGVERDLIADRERKRAAAVELKICGEQRLVQQEGLGRGVDHAGEKPVVELRFAVEGDSGAGRFDLEVGADADDDVAAEFAIGEGGRVGVRVEAGTGHDAEVQP